MTALAPPAPELKPPAPAVDEAALEAQVAGSSFYTAMRLMPRAERAGMYAVYAFCRQVDDIADDARRPRPSRAADLDAWRGDLDRLYAGRETARAAFLASAVERFGLRREDFEAVIDGMQTDVDGDVVAPSWDALDLYCDRVASAVGRLSVDVFGMDRPVGVELAHHLGRALQLTNILRDLDEDAEIGRLYLPREALERAGVATRPPRAAVDDPAVDAACREVAARAQAHYDAADLVMAARPRGRIRTPRLMSAVYRVTLARTEAQGWRPPRTRPKVGRAQLIWIVLRTGLIG